MSYMCNINYVQFFYTAFPSLHKALIHIINYYYLHIYIYTSNAVHKVSQILGGIEGFNFRLKTEAVFIRLNLHAV